MDLSVSMPWWNSLSIDFQSLLQQYPYTILYFYPKDNTSWCSLEAQDFSSLYDIFLSLWIQVFGISKDSHKSHCTFMEKYSLWFPLISDPELVLHRYFSVLAEKSMYGKTYLWTVRSTYILDVSGSIVYKRYNIKAKWHAQDVLDRVKWHL